MAHEVLVGVPQQVIALGTRSREVEVLEDPDELGQAVDELPALTQLVGVVEVGVVDDTLQVVGVRELPDSHVDLLADVRAALECDQVIERPASGHLDVGVHVGLRLVRDVLHEQQRQDVVLVLTGVHAAAKLVGTGPERAVEVRLLQGHGHLSADTFGSRPPACPGSRS